MHTIFLPGGAPDSHIGDIILHANEGLVQTKIAAVQRALGAHWMIISRVFASGTLPCSSNIR